MLVSNGYESMRVWGPTDCIVARSDTLINTITLFDMPGIDDFFKIIYSLEGFHLHSSE